jgi:shikimate kinase
MMNANPLTRIFLIGYMGAGKTTLGRILSRRLNFSFIDTDFYIEHRYRKKVGDIFNACGEQRFREMERRILCEVSEFERVVVSTGGGLPCFNDNMKLMNEKGTTVYLEASTDALAARLQASRTIRPVLQNRSGSELTAFIGEHLERRRPFYEQAGVRFQTDPMVTNGDAEALADKLEQLIYDHTKLNR